jgi:hypothetical protein
MFLLIFIKNSKEHLKILKTTSGSSPRTDLSKNTTFSLTQSHATVPLKQRKNGNIQYRCYVQYSKEKINLPSFFSNFQKLPKQQDQETRPLGSPHLFRACRFVE